MAKTASKDIVIVNETININRYDNGFMVEYTGQDAKGDYHTRKVVCNDEARVHELLSGLFVLPLAE